MAQDSERILDEATDWLLLLADAPDDGEARARFNQWISADPRHAVCWDEINRSYELIGKAQAAPKTVWQAQENKQPTTSRGFRRRWNDSDRPSRSSSGSRQRVRNLAIAASLALLLLWSGPGVWLAVRADHHTSSGELETVRLEDGSIAQLGPDSAVRIHYRDDERQIELLAGQALFDVEPDRDRPFRVMAGDVTTTVLGTSFDVRRLASSTEVGVRHGRVGVETPVTTGERIVLHAGDRFTIDDKGSARTEHGSTLLIAAWAHGEVNARDRTVEDVIDDIRPWYRGRIIIADRKLGSKRVNGVYSPRDPLQALRSVVAPYGASVTTITPWVIVVGL